MRTLPHILLAASLTACPPPTDDDPDPVQTWSFTLSGTAEPHAEQRMLLAVVDSTGAVVEDGVTTVGTDGTFSFSWADILDDGEAYTVDFYADLNGSDGCDAPPADHAWRETIPAVTADVSIDWEHNTDFVDVCETFGGYGDPPLYDLAFTAALAPHADQKVTAAVVDVETDTVKTTRTETVATDGALIMSWTRILEPGKDYRLDFYADHNGNDMCDAPPDDHAWRILIDDVAADVQIDFPHDTDFTDVCATFE